MQHTFATLAPKRKRALGALLQNVALPRQGHVRLRPIADIGAAGSTAIGHNARHFVSGQDSFGNEVEQSVALKKHDSLLVFSYPNEIAPEKP